MDKVTKTLHELDIEDLIWVIYIFISALAIYSNYLERIYVTKHDVLAKKKYKTINISVLSIGFFIYLYFLILAYQKYKEKDNRTTLKNILIKDARLIASILLIICAIIALLSEIMSDDDTDIDLLV
mgnify:FL=1